MKTKEIEAKAEGLGHKIIKLVYDETLILSQKHEVGETIAVVEAGTILALAATASTLSRMLMGETNRTNFIQEFKAIMIEVLDKAATIKASDLVRH